VTTWRKLSRRVAWHLAGSDRCCHGADGAEVPVLPVLYDLLIQRGKVFDGTGEPPRIADVAVRHGQVVAISEAPLASTDADKVMDANGLWVTPGFIDIHTHYDAEVLLAPGLQESVRHGVSKRFIGSCSISMIYSDAEDASDIVTRVESIPREYVLPALRQEDPGRRAELRRASAQPAARAE
jgi:N-acyl-D-aspartate/D-glutamate deacylase